MDDFQQWLVARTELIATARIMKQRGLGIMPLIEIKGLGAAVAGAKKGISDLRSAAAGLNTETTALNLEIVDLTEQVKQHRKDLRFEAETLGNSPPPDEPEKPPPPVASPQAALAPLIQGSAASTEPAT